MSTIGLKYLCPPAQFYLFISLVALFVMCFNNFGTRSIFCLGSQNCDVDTVYTVFFIQIFYIIIWAWVFNIICRKTSPILSWIIALAPFVLFFLSMFLLYYKTQ